MSAAPRKRSGPTLGIPRDVLARIDELGELHGSGGLKLPRGDVLIGLINLAVLHGSDAAQLIRAASADAAVRDNEGKRRGLAAAAATMTAEQRSERARAGANARWKKKSELG